MGDQLRVASYGLQTPNCRLQVGSPGSRFSDISEANADGERLRTACQEFESLLLDQILKGLRRTVPEGESRQEALYRSLLDEQVAKLCAERGLGLSELLASRLEEKMGRQSPGPSETRLKVSEKTPIRETPGVAPMGRGALAPMEEAVEDNGIGGPR
jgi:peptidoglycan hydrolase FlgJ